MAIAPAFTCSTNPGRAFTFFPCRLSLFSFTIPRHIFMRGIPGIWGPFAPTRISHPPPVIVISIIPRFRRTQDSHLHNFYCGRRQHNTYYLQISLLRESLLSPQPRSFRLHVTETRGCWFWNKGRRKPSHCSLSARLSP